MEKLRAKAPPKVSTDTPKHAKPRVRTGWGTPSPHTSRSNSKPADPWDTPKSQPGRFASTGTHTDRRKEALLGVGEGYSSFYDDNPRAHRGRIPSPSVGYKGPFDHERAASAGARWPRGGYVGVRGEAPAEVDRSIDKRHTSSLAPRRVAHARSKNITNPILMTEYPRDDVGDREYGAYVRDFSHFLSAKEEPPENPTPKSPEKGAPLYRSYLRPAEERFAIMSPQALTKTDLERTGAAFKALPAPPPVVRSMKELLAPKSAKALPSPVTGMAEMVTFGTSEAAEALTGGGPRPSSGASVPPSPIDVDTGRRAQKPSGSDTAWEPPHGMVFDKDNTDKPPHASFLFDDGFEYKAEAGLMKKKPKRRPKKTGDEPQGIVLPWEMELYREEQRRKKREAAEQAQVEAKAKEAARLEAARRARKPLMQVYIETLKPIRLSDQAFTHAVQLTRARKIHVWYARLKAKWEKEAHATRRAAHARRVLELNAAKTIQQAWMRFSHRKFALQPGVAFSESPSKRLNELGARSRPRFRPSRKAMSLLFPPDSRKHTRRKFASMRLWLREVMREWRNAAAAAIYLRECQDKLVVLGKAFRFHTINRRIHRRRLEYASANMIQDVWRVKMNRVRVKAAYMILPIIKKHLWYLRRQRLRSLRHSAARALQRFTQRVITRLRERMGAEVIVKRAMVARRMRVVARRGRQLMWFKYRIMVRRISNAWFKERAFRARIMARATKRLAASLIRARKRLAERRERIGPVHWELLHLQQIKEGKAAVKIQAVFRGFMGRFRAKIVKMQYNLVRLPLDLAARKIQSGWRFYNIRRRLRRRRKKVERFDLLKIRQVVAKARAGKLGAMAIKRYRRVRRHAYPKYKAIWAAKIVQKFYRKTLVRRDMIRHANQVFKMKRAILLLESCAVRLQKRWLKHRYPFGLPKYRLRRDDAAELFQSAWRGYKGRKRFKEALREYQKQEAARLAAEKQATVSRYKRRLVAQKSWIVPFVGARLLIWGWRAQWSLVFKTEAARQLSIRQFELTMRIQRKWRLRVAHRKGVRANRAALRKMYGKLWSKAKRLKGGASLLSGLGKKKDLMVGDRVIARFAGGVKEFPAIITAMHVTEAKEVTNKKTGELELKPTRVRDAFTFEVKYSDGCLEKDVPRDWLTFDMRPYISPQEGLYDEDFLNAPKELPGVATIKKFVKKVQERHQEVGFSQTAKAITPALPGKKPDANAAVTGIAIIAGEQANESFANRQLQRRLLLKPYFEKTYPDLRAAIRTNREREDRLAVHLWVLKDTTGPFITDLRLIFPNQMKQDTPFWNAIIAAGFNVLVRPNMPEADTFPLPVDGPELPIPVAIAVKINSDDNPLIDVRPSSMMAGELGVHRGASDTDLFQEGYSPLPEDLAMFHMDARARMWMKWRQRKTEKPLVGVGRRESFDEPEQHSSEDEDAVLDGVTRRRRVEEREAKRNMFLLQPTRAHLEVVLDGAPSAAPRAAGASRRTSKDSKPSVAPSKQSPSPGGSVESKADDGGGGGVGEDDENGVSIGGAFPRRLLHAAAEGTSKSAIEEGRRLVKEAVGASASTIRPFKAAPNTLLKYGGADVIDMAMQLRTAAMDAQSQAELAEGDSLTLPPVSVAESALSVDTRPTSRGSRRSRMKRATNVVKAASRLRSPLSRGGRTPQARSSPLSRGRRTPMGRTLSPIGGAKPPQPPPESAEESTDDDSDAMSASSSDPSMPEQGEFDDGTEWGKYTTVFEEDFSKMEVVELDGPQTAVVLACRFTDLQIAQMAEFFRAVKPALGVRAVGIHQIVQAVGWSTSLGPLRREMYQLIRISEDSLLKFKLFIEWLARFLLLGKPDLTRILFRGFDSSKRGDMTRGDFIYLVEVLHPTLSAPKRTQMVNVAGKLLALKTETLGEAFKMKDFLIMNNKFPSLAFPWYQLQIDLQRVLFGEVFWKNARDRIERMPAKPGGTSVPVVYDEYSGK